MASFSFAVAFDVFPPVARKNLEPTEPASMFSTEVRSAVNLAFARLTQSPFVVFTQPLPNAAFRTFVVLTRFRLKSSMKE
jgi:hypothetical protein